MMVVVRPENLSHLTVREAERRVCDLLSELKTHNDCVRVVYFGQELMFNKSDSPSFIYDRLQKADRQDVSAGMALT